LSSIANKICEKIREQAYQIAKGAL
jgi:hypothetical protein